MMQPNLMGRIKIGTKLTYVFDLDGWRKLAKAHFLFICLN